MPELSVMSFNIRTSLADDGPNHWRHRRDLVLRTIREAGPDLVGIQEPTEEQWSFLLRGLADGWAGLAHSRRDESGAESHLQGLFFRRGRVQRIADGTFWLSETPQIAGSVSFPQDWGARTVVWLRARDLEAERELLFAVTHLDTNPGSWLPSVKVAARETPRLAGSAPVLLGGDFNCAAGSEAWRWITGEGGFTDAWTACGRADEGVTTFNAFTAESRLPLDRPEHLDALLHRMCDGVPVFKHYPDHVRAHRNYRIDWLLSRGPLVPTSAEVVTRTFDGRAPSDHYPVTARFAWT